MEIARETPPPLPPKTKQKMIDSEESHSKMKVTNAYCTTIAQNGGEVGSLKIVNSRLRNEDNGSPPQSLPVFESKTTASQSEKIPSEDKFLSSADIKKSETGSSETKNEVLGPKIITWADSKKKEEEHRKSESLYENVSNDGLNYLEDCLKSIEASRDVRKPEVRGTVGKSSGKRKTPKIEVRQEEHKTVVKISIKDTPTPEEEMNGGNRFNFRNENVYENGFQGANGFTSVGSNVYANCSLNGEDSLVYENANVLAMSEEKGTCDNLSSGCYENVQDSVPDERVYANVSASFGYDSRIPKKELITEANYGNLNGEDSGCDQVYKNHEFQISKNNLVSIISQNLMPLAINSPACEVKDDELYENIQNDCRVYANENLYRNNQIMAGKCDETAEKMESRKKGKSNTEKKSSFVEVFLQRTATMVKVEKPEGELGDGHHSEDHSSGDPFDSGTCSDVDSLPTLVQSKKGNVVVTIKSLQNEEKMEDLKKTELCHRRAESLTSSGVGVDSEESDDEKSNISCDSLNSNEPYAQSNSEDHGYHTPNSEDKTGSPIDHIEYENVIKKHRSGIKIDQSKRTENFQLDEDFSVKGDIIQQVADVSQKIKNLRTESHGVYVAKLIEPSDFEDYENVRMFEGVAKNLKKKPAPPPPPLKPSLATLQGLSEEVGYEKNKKFLPKNLLQDIRSQNVRLSSTCPSGEKPADVKSEEDAPNLSSLSGKVSNTINKLRKVSENDTKKLMVEEKTYEERKNEVKSVKVNKICAMEVDTDKFYKFHLSENVRENGKDGVNDGEMETFAGIKDYLSLEKPSAITSAKGTIRGVKNRVKAGIATFLQIHENKSYKEKDAGKVVVYTTSMGIVRKTYQNCLKIKQILRTLMVDFEERDVFMSKKAQEEIRDRMKCDTILVPQMFVEGQHIGDAETIERLNEMGELRTILKPYRESFSTKHCEVCGGYRLLLCIYCNGSKKSIHRNNFTDEFASLRCVRCDAVGLVKCHAC